MGLQDTKKIFAFHNVGAGVDSKKQWTIDAMALLEEDIRELCQKNVMSRLDSVGVERYLEEKNLQPI